MIKKLPIWFKILVAVTVVGFGYMIIENYYINYQYDKHSVTIEATIVDWIDGESSEEGYFNASHSVNSKLRYKFEVSGKEYIGTDIWMAGEFHPIDKDRDKVLIEYLKENPEQNRLKSSEGIEIIVK